ncbi:hypothetical protein ACIQUM_37975 [Amycolatopsis azurea]|uniref:hypothetical protein n=1 Tax=Amycolatopsis azurea TaxID=36819 RepID=UPI00380D7DD8
MVSYARDECPDMRFEVGDVRDVRKSEVITCLAKSSFSIEREVFKASGDASFTVDLSDVEMYDNIELAPSELEGAPCCT